LKTASGPVPAESEHPVAAASARPADSYAIRALPFLLSVIAGSTDIIGFLGLNGLFTAHITGNLVVLAAHVVIGDKTILSYLLSVPVFMAVLTRERRPTAAWQAAPRPQPSMKPRSEGGKRYPLIPDKPPPRRPTRATRRTSCCKLSSGLTLPCRQ
jgi:hypothetical protein